MIPPNDSPHENHTQPAVAILGRPNVGKSTLFNQLTGSRDSLVADTAGMTRDIKIGASTVGGRPFLVADTGGIESDADSGIAALVTEQALSVVDDSERLLLVVDAKDGVNAEDVEIADILRRTGKPTFVIVNKIDGANPELVSAEFAELGFGNPIPISARDGAGIGALVETITAGWPLEEEYPEENAGDGIRVAIVGRPNVGKSTLVNRMLGEERMITADLPGTTHDSVETRFTRRDQAYTLIDTAGIRRRGKIKETIEKFSAVRALQAIELCHVAVVVIDAQENITDQDTHLLGLVLRSGRSLVIAVNKWDGLAREQRELLKRELERKLVFVEYAERLEISALHGTGVGELFDKINAAYRSSRVTLKTSIVTEMLEDAIENHPPPLVRGRRVKLRYAHVGGQNPPTIVVHGNLTKALPESYKRYLANFFRTHLNLTGTPVRMEFRQGGNPFAGRKNELTQRQMQRKRRLMKHVKRKR